MDDKKIEQPSSQLQEILDTVLEQEPTVYKFRGRTHKMGWLGNMTIRKFTHISLKEKDIHKRNVKLCAALRVDSLFAWFRPLVYAIKWRYYYYVIDLPDTEVLRVLDAAKKKSPQDASTLITILSTGLQDTRMSMMRKEVSAIPAVQVGERHTV